jgi:predicted negative regulator of RcsB-dependent stress response
MNSKQFVIDFLLVCYFLIGYTIFSNAQTTAYLVTPAESQSYQGHYEFSQLRILEIRERDGKFYGQLESFILKISMPK